MDHTTIDRVAGRVSLVLALGVALAACGGGETASAPSVVRVDSAGIEIVTSAVDDRPLAWTFERQYALGGAEEGPESFYSMYEGLVDADERGRLYVLDPTSARVVVFEPDGTFLRTIGGRGEGPGELSRPASLAVGGAGELAVFDFGKSALVRFDSAGGAAPAQPFPFYPPVGGGRHFRPSPTGVFVTAMLPGAPEGSFNHGLRHISVGDTILLTNHLFPQPGMAMYASCGGGLNLPRVFEMEVKWDSRRATAVAAASPDYLLTQYEGTSPVRSIRTGRAARPATEAMAREQLGEGFRINFGQGPCTIPPEEMVPERGFADVIPWVDRIALSPSGEVWVQRFEVGQGVRGAIDLFDESGAYIGTAPAETPFPLVFLDADTFGAAERDAQDVTRLVVYRVVRGG